MDGWPISFMISLSYCNGGRMDGSGGTRYVYDMATWETVPIDAGFADGPCAEVGFYADVP